MLINLELDNEVDENGNPIYTENHRKLIELIKNEYSETMEFHIVEYPLLNMSINAVINQFEEWISNPKQCVLLVNGWFRHFNNAAKNHWLFTRRFVDRVAIIDYKKDNGDGVGHYNFGGDFSYWVAESDVNNRYLKEDLFKYIGKKAIVPHKYESLIKNGQYSGPEDPIVFIFTNTTFVSDEIGSVIPNPTAWKWFDEDLQEDIIAHVAFVHYELFETARFLGACNDTNSLMVGLLPERYDRHGKLPWLHLTFSDSFLSETAKDLVDGAIRGIINQ